MRTVAVVGVTLAMFAAAAACAAEDDDRSAVFLKLADREAAGWTIRSAVDANRSPQRETEPLLRWTNPVAGELYGGVYLWTERGCPVAVASVYKWYAPFTHLSVEFHSLDDGPLTVQGPEGGLWSPNRAGIEWKVVPDAGMPGGTPAARLREMRALLRDFSADETDREGEVRPLRLLAQPLWRFKSENADVLDGAVFAFVESTDPEILLLLAARRDEGEEFRWEYAPARMNSVELRLRHRGQPAWDAPELTWRAVGNRNEPYWVRRREVEPAAP